MSDNVIKISYLEGGIAIIAMEDRESKNTFSKRLIDELNQAFTNINNDMTLKVVIIHGFDNYFCCGGTKDELLELTEGNITFADFGFYRLLLDCPLPVIAAMQGHAIGAGFAFGSSADIIIMAEESFYSTNFMKYGFTPGFGATYFMPKKLGINITNNMLFAAQSYQGLQLKELGMPILFVKRTQVIQEAIHIAQEIITKTRDTIVALKQQLTQVDQAHLTEFINEEIDMHKVTFQLPEVKNKIIELLGK